MAQFPALPLFTDAYLADCGHLTTIEHGAYLLLLMTAWRTDGCRLPNDDRVLARYCRLTPAQWKRIKPGIIGFFTEEDGFLYQGRLTDELTFVRQVSKRQSDKVKARWLKQKGTTSTTVLPDAYPHTPPTPPKKERKKPATGISGDWKVPEEWVETGRQTYPTLNIQREAQKFTDYHISKGTKFADWKRAFLGTWLTNAAGYAGIEPAKGGNGAKPLTPEQQIRLDRMKALHDAGWDQERIRAAGDYWTTPDDVFNEMVGG